MDHCLTHRSLLFGIRAILIDQGVDDTSVSPGSGQVDRLRSIMAVTLLTQLEAGHGVVAKRAGHVLEDLVGLFETDQLEDIHVAFELEGLHLLLGHTE